jgi:hypothetical protein
MKMTVVSAVLNRDDPSSMKQIVQQTHAALLYADSVTLVSPVAALMKSTHDISKLDGLDLLFELNRAGPKYFPDIEADISGLKEIVDGLPPRRLWTSELRRHYDGVIKEFVSHMGPLRDLVQANANEIMANSGFDQLQLAIEAGILTVESLPGMDIAEIEDTAGEAMLSLLHRIDETLTSGRQYPLFDGETNEFVRNGVEAGIFAPTPIARRLGQKAAMADGLFDRLPSFEYATTSEILDIRTELSPSLGAFRTGVGSLTEQIEVAPEDPQFGNEVEYAWNETVAPAIDEIEATIRENKSMADLTRRFAKDSVGGGAIGAAVTLPFSLTVAAGPVGQLMTATGMVFGVGLGTIHGLIDEHAQIKKAKKAVLLPIRNERNARDPLAHGWLDGVGKHSHSPCSSMNRAAQSSSVKVIVSSGRTIARSGRRPAGRGKGGAPALAAFHPQISPVDTFTGRPVLNASRRRRRGYSSNA